MLFSAKKKGTINIEPLRVRKHKCILLSERSQFEKAPSCVSPTWWLFGKGRTMETVRSKVAKGQGKEGWTEGAWRILPAVKLLYDVVMVDTCPYRLVQTQRMSIPKANYRLRVIRRCQCRFTNCNKRTTLLWDVDSGGGSACVGAGAIWELSALLLNFSVT